MEDPKRWLWEGPNFKKLPQFLKSNRISHACGITSNIDQTSIDKSCFVFLLYRGVEEYVDFVPFSGALGKGGIAAFGPLESAFEGQGSPPPVNTYIGTIHVYLQNLKTISAFLLPFCARSEVRIPSDAK